MKSGWYRKPLAEIGSIFNGNSVSDNDKKKLYGGSGEGLPYIATKDVGFDNVINYDSGVMIPTSNLNDFKIAPKNSVLVCAEGGSAGRKIAHNDRSVCFGNKLFAIAPTSLADSSYIFYFCLSNDFQTQFRDQMAGLIGGVSLNKFKSLTVPIPSLLEQQRIVTLLDQAFENIATTTANAEKNLANARELFDSTLQSIFTQDSSDWIENTVGNLVSEGLLLKPFDGNHGEIHPRKADFTKSGVPFIMASDLHNGGVDTKHCNFIPRELADSLRVGFAKDGDVLISHKGTIGRTVIVTTEYDYIMLTPQVTSYRIKDYARLANRFVRYLFISSYFQKQFLRGAEDGSTRAYIGITKQLSLRFRYPPLEKQKKIVEELDDLSSQTQRLEAIYQQKLVALEELKKSILNQAFSGQLH